MGYNTDFEGAFRLDKPLTPDHANYLRAFNGTRRMRRDSEKAQKLPDPLREKVGLPIGEEGAYFVGGGGFAGQDSDDSIVNHNNPPLSQPGLWCKWEPNEEGTLIQWDGNEKFYDYVEWLQYLITNFLQPWGYTLNGEVDWYGEDRSDIGKIVVVNNEVTVHQGRITYDK